MRCNNCGLCCKETEMLLSEADIKLLEKAGYQRRDFVRVDRMGFARLRNKRGWCFFFDVGRKRCEAYRSRPLGCWIYPVAFSEDESRAIVDDLCPMRGTVSDAEIGSKSKTLVRLLKRIDREAARRVRFRV